MKIAFAAPALTSILSPVVTLAMLLGLASTSPAVATTQDQVLAAQVLPGWRTRDKTQMAAVRLDLAPGWKTYWRRPGEGGIPPQFDWSGSRNLKSVVLHWPSPSVFQSNGMTTIGYRDSLVLPIELVAIDPAQPITLRAELALGICRDICIPANLSLAAEVGGAKAVGAERSDPAIVAALAAKPISGKQAGLRRISCAVAPIKDGLRLTATVQMPKRGDSETVAFEVADPAIWISEADSHRSGNTLTATTELVPPNGQPFALDRSSITLTVLRSDGAVEINGCPAG